MNKFQKKYLHFRLFHKYQKSPTIHIEKQDQIDQWIDLDLDPTTHVEIKKNLLVRNNVSIRCRGEATLKIGENVFINNNCVITCREKVVIGNGVMFGPNVSIFDHDHDFRSGMRHSTFICKEIILEDNVWVGANVCILKGAKIGKNAVIAAGAIVSGTVPENTLYLGKDNMRPIEKEAKKKRTHEKKN